MTHHLAIIHARYIAAILSGKKVIECRLSKTRVSPFGAVSRGDKLWIKHPGGPVVATALVRRVTFYDPLTPQVVAAITKRYGPSLAAEAGLFIRHRNARYATLMLLGGVRRLTPFCVRKRDRRAWVVLEEPPCPTLGQLNPGRDSPVPL